MTNAPYLFSSPSPSNRRSIHTINYYLVAVALPFQTIPNNAVAGLQLPALKGLYFFLQLSSGVPAGHHAVGPITSLQSCRKYTSLSIQLPDGMLFCL
jgi:hypothetical protein